MSRLGALLLGLSIVWAGAAKAGAAWGADRLPGGPEPLALGPGQRPEKIGEVHRLQGHRDPVCCVAFSPDGRLALTASGDATVRVWNAATGQPIRLFQGHRLGVLAAVFSPDSKRILSGGSDGTILLWEVASGREVRKYPHDSWITALAFFPKGDRFLSAGTSFGLPNTQRQVRLWETATGTEFGGFDHPMDHVTSLAVSADGRRALCAGGYAANSDTPLDAMVRVWDPETFKVLFDLKPPIRTVLRGTALSPDGSQVLAVDVENRRLPALWDVASGKVVRRFPSGESTTVAAISRDGRLGATGNSRGEVAVWDLERGRLLVRFSGHSLPVDSIAFSPDAQHLLSGGTDKTARLWRLPESARLQPKALGEKRFEPGRPQPVRVAGQPLREAEAVGPIRTLKHDAYVYSVAIAPDGRRALSSGFDLTVRLWDVNSGQEVRKFKGDRAGDLVNALAWSSDGRHALWGGGQYLKTEQLRLWDVEAWREVRRYEGLESVVSCVAFSPDGRLALAGTLDGIVHVWEAGTGRRVSRYKPPVRGARSLAVAPDGRLAVYVGGHEDLRLRAWDVSTGRERHLFDEGLPGPQSAVFSPDGQAVLAGGDRAIGLWNAASGQLLRRISVPDSLSAAAFLPNGRLAIAGGRSGSVGVWDLQTGREIRRMQGHSQQVTAVAIAPSGRYALSAGYDNAVRMWPLPE